MATSTASNSVIGELQSAAQSELLDAVDKLISEGLQPKLNLPQLIVCGDQSSGKSSVLEAVSRLSFPAADTFCTRFAMELVLRKESTPSFDVSLHPSQARMENSMENTEAIAHIKRFQCPSDTRDESDLPKVVQAATEHMEQLVKCAFYEDKLVVRISGPDKPSLTLVDLPGIIQSSNKDQRPEDVHLVKRIVESYMQNDNSIMLLILAADNNVSNQGVLELAKKYDPDRQRTLGIITKPDRVDADSANEEDWILRAQNRMEYLGLGWHVLKNRDFKHRASSADDRDGLEAQFFGKTNWSSLDASSRGVATLRSRLSEILLQQVLTNLPGIFANINKEIQESKDILGKLGVPKTTEKDRRHCLIDISSQLGRLIDKGTQGIWQDSFFQSRNKSTREARRLRAKLRSIMDAFSNHLLNHGHLYHIEHGSSANGHLPGCADFSNVPETLDAEGRPVIVSYEAVLKGANDFARDNRNCDLSVHGSSALAMDLFQKQSARWEVIARHYLELCSASVNDFFHEALSYVAPEHTTAAIMINCTDPELEKNHHDLMDKLTELMRPYRRNYPMIAREELLKYSPNTMVAQNSMQQNQDAAPASTTHAATESLHMMGAYYELVINRFIENINSLAVEACLVDRLHELFTSMVVVEMDTDLLQKLTAEPESISHEREKFQEKLHVLKDIQTICRHHFVSAGTSAMIPGRQTDRPRYPTKSPEIEVPVHLVANEDLKPRQPTTPLKKNYKGQAYLPLPNVLTPPITPEPPTVDKQRTPKVSTVQCDYQFGEPVTFGSSSGSSSGKSSENSRYRSMTEGSERKIRSDMRSGSHHNRTPTPPIRWNEMEVRESEDEDL